MKKRFVALFLAVALVITTLISLSVSATVENVTVPVTITGNYLGVNHWANATYTYAVTDGVVADNGILSNGTYTFKYYPGAGQIKNASQATSFAYETGKTSSEIIIPTSIGAFTAAGVSYAAKDIVLTSTNTNYAIFRYDSAANVTIVVPEGATAIPDNVFGQMQKTNTNTQIILPSTLTKIGNNSFAQSSNGGLFNNITIPNSVTSIGSSAFSNCRFTDVIVPAGVTTISSGAFSFVGTLKNVTFKGAVTNIADAAFRKNNALETMTFEGKNAPTYTGAPFSETTKVFTVYYPANGVGYDAASFTGMFPVGTVFVRKAGAPSASGLSATGSNVVGSTLQGTYTTFTDPMGNFESGSTATWRRASDKAFTTGIEDIKTEPISVGSISSYTLTSADDGKYIQFSVIPRNAAAEYNQGDEASVVFNDQIRSPQTKPVVSLTSPSMGFKAYVNAPVTLKANATCDATTITKIEYYANDTLVEQGTSAPFDAAWTPDTACDYSLYARAYNALGESTDSSSVSIKIYALDQPMDPVWAKKWSYDFNSFTSTDTYSSTKPLTLPGTNPPSVTFNSGGTAKSVSGLFGKDANDYHMELDSIAGGTEAARTYFNMSSLDDPVKNIVAEMDIAFSTTNERRLPFGYRTSKGPYNSFSFSEGGVIGCYNDSGFVNFKDSQGQNLTYQANKWYHIAAVFDFDAKTITYYVDGTKYATTTPQDIVSFTYTSEISLKGVHSNNYGAVYYDNLSLGQVQDSYITSVLTTPTDGSYLANSAISFKGYAKDSIGSGIDRVEFYANGSLIAQTTGSTYSFTKTDMPCGHYTLIAKAISKDGFVGYSLPVQMTVDGISFPTMIADNMLLQRNKPIVLTGTGNENVVVTAEINGSTASAAVSGGKWRITLPPQPATKSTDLKFTTSRGVTTIFENVAVGELIMCSGQSNMAYAINSFSALAGEADKDYPDIRLFKQDIVASSTQQTNIPSGYWTPATQSAASSFSAVGFISGKKYYLAENGEVPVGLIFAAEGGTNINTWVTPTAFNNDPDLIGMKSNSTDYNAMVAPWTNFTIGHIIWYQGEANTYFENNYEKALTAYIDSYRETWKDNSINFIIIQLPIYDYPTAYAGGNRTAVGVRDGEFNVSERLQNVATVISIDTGSAGGIHPADKLPLCERASLALQHFTDSNNTSLVWKSPSFDHAVQNGNTMTIYLKNTGGTMTTKDGQAARGFKIAGDDGIFADTAVTLVGNTIVVDTSSVVGAPKVRYAWEDVPARSGDSTTLNLVGGTGLATAPFRTDSEKYHKRFENGVFTTPYNYVPMIHSITDGDIVNGTARITVSARDYDGTITKVDVYSGSTLLGQATNVSGTADYTFDWIGAQPGTYNLSAIATDSDGATSVKTDPTRGTTTVSAKSYSLTLAVGADVQILPFENLSGVQIQTFNGQDGVKVKATKDSTSILVLAAYKDNKLINMKIGNGDSASFTSSELTDATIVKAFIMSDLGAIRPLTDLKSIQKN